VRFKEAVAGDWGTWHSLWLTAERELHEDIDWIFGFELPRNGTGNGKSETPVPGPERRPQPKTNGPVLSEEQLSLDRGRMRKLRETVRSKERHMLINKEAVEAWHLADTEAWRFARAWSARTRVERRKWEEEERGYAGAESRRKGAGWGRWFDRKE